MNFDKEPFDSNLATPPQLIPSDEQEMYDYLFEPRQYVSESDEEYLNRKEICTQLLAKLDSKE